MNLDEVLPRAGPRLPTLEIHTRPTSAPPAPYTAPVKQSAPVPASRIGTPRSGTPQPGIRNTALATAQMRLGPQPQLDEGKVKSLLDIDPGMPATSRVRVVSHNSNRQPTPITCFYVGKTPLRFEGADCEYIGAAHIPPSDA